MGACFDCALHSTRDQLRVIESFVDMESLIKQANMSSDTVRHSKTVAKLQSQQANLRTRLAESQKRVEELEARVKILRAGEDGRAPVRAGIPCCVVMCCALTCPALCAQGNANPATGRGRDKNAHAGEA